MTARDEFEDAVRDALDVCSPQPPIPADIVHARRARLLAQTRDYIAEREAPGVIAAFEELLKGEAS